MTNLISIVQLTLALGTNWTGHVTDAQELGYVVTNYQVAILCEGCWYTNTIKTTRSSLAAWRSAQWYYTTTNMVWPWSLVR